MLNGALGRRRHLVIGLVVLALLTSLTGLRLKPTTVMTPRNSPTPQDSISLLPSVTIKTLDAANAHLRNGAIRGIDVSQYNGTIDWNKVSKDNVDFAMIRASIDYRNDTTFLYNARNAHENGLYVGAYHYAKFSDTASMKKEAQVFLGQLDQVTITYPVVLDVEANRGLSQSQLTNLCIQFMDILKDNGYNPMFYTYQNFITEYKCIDVSAIEKAGYEMWIANYVREPSGIDHVMWQHTSYGSVSGITGRVDINVAYHNLAGGSSGGGSFFNNGGSSSGGGSSGSGISFFDSTPSADSSSSASEPDTAPPPDDSEAQPATPAAPPQAVTVDRDISNSIKTTLNDRYDAGLPLEGLDMGQMNKAIISGLQTELNKQLSAGLSVTGTFDADTQAALDRINFEPHETGGSITYLVQARLFYRGAYTQSLTSLYDEHMVEAVQEYQRQQGLGVTGQLDSTTLARLFNAS